jgi:hypothetical protein
MAATTVRPGQVRTRTTAGKDTEFTTDGDGVSRKGILLPHDALIRTELVYHRSDSLPPTRVAAHDERKAPGEPPWMRLKARLNAASVA